MQEYLNKGIKEVIKQFPPVADILNEYDIGCVPCSVGTCLLKDIVQIHNLSPEHEQSLMAKISRVISPGQEIPAQAEQPARKEKPETEIKEIKYSPPVKKLVEEHVLIKCWIALIPAVIKNMNLESPEGRQLIMDGVDFIRSYADKYHHAKEEDILFKYFDANLDIIKVMYEDHETGRAHVRAIVEGVNKKDKKSVAEHLLAYQELLTGHIKKEDEILYPWLDRQLTTTQIGEMFAKFNETDLKFGQAPKKYEEFVNKIATDYSD
ncbi:MAG: hemerythrin domain-containing protein [Planctomycetota bacterium]